MTEQDVNHKETSKASTTNHRGVDSSSEDEDDSHHHGNKRTWEESFALLQAYKKKHGHCQVPIRFEQDRRLGRWVNRQRIRRDKLTADQIRRLEELGFEHEEEDDRDENDHNNNTHDENDHRTTTRRPSHQELDEEEDDDDDEEEEEDEDDDEIAPAPASHHENLLDVGFTHTGRRRKAVKRYGITDNDDESDIARRRKELERQQRDQQQQRQKPKQPQHRPRLSMQPPKPRAALTSTNTSSTSTSNNNSNSTSSSMTPSSSMTKQSPKVTPKKVAPSPAPPPPATPPPPPPPVAQTTDDDDEEEDPDYDSEEERRAREKRRKQRRQQQQQQSSSSKGGKPKGRPRGRPRKETLEEKLEQIVVGSRLAVLWPAENEYYRATVAKVVEGRKRPYYLEYDDGETEWIDLGTGHVEFLVLTPRIGPRKRNRSKAASAQNNSSTTPNSTPARATTTTTPKTDHSASASRNSTPNNNNNHSSNRTPSSHNNNNNSRPVIQLWERVSVYWSDDEQYYEATVVKQRKDRDHPKPFKLEYEDGEYEWIDLHRVKFRFLDRGDDSVITPVRKSGRQRRKPHRMRITDEIVEEDSSDEDDDDDDDDDSEDDTEEEPEDVVGRDPHASSRAANPMANEGDRGGGGDNRRRSSHNNDTTEDSSSESGSSSNSSSSSSTGDDSDIELVSDVKQVHVGSRVAVYWSEEERYFEGTVTEHRKGHPRPFFMQYDDGDTQWLDLRTRNFCVLKRVERRTRKQRRRSSSSRRRGRRRSRMNIFSDSSDSDDEEEPRQAVGGRFSLARRNVRRQPPPAASRPRPKCLSPTPTETSATTDDEREERLESLEEPSPSKEIALGTRVTVFCPVKDKFLDGTVTHRQIPRNSRCRPCYYVAYDKGHSEWIELPKRKVRFLTEEEASLMPKTGPAKRGRKRKPHDSPLLRMLREKEARKANPDLALEEDEDDPDKLKVIPESENKFETTDSDDSSSSSESDESLDATTEDDISIPSEAEPEPPTKPLVVDQIGIGTRIAVKCPKELKFMEGTVTRLIRNRRKPFYVEYDIGGFEWIDLHGSTVKLLTEEEEKLLKEQSAIVIKEEVEEALPVVEQYVFEIDDDSDQDDAMGVEVNATTTTKAAEKERYDAKDIDDNIVKESGESVDKIDDNKEADNKNTSDPVDADVEMAEAHAAVEEVLVQSETEEKKDTEGDETDKLTDNSIPQLEDEDADDAPATLANTEKEQHSADESQPTATTNVERASPAPVEPDTRDPPRSQTSPKPSGILGVAKIEIPTRVSDSDGASSSEKDSPTAVACVLGSSKAAEKVCKVGAADVALVSIPELKASPPSPKASAAPPAVEETLVDDDAVPAQDVDNDSAPVTLTTTAPSPSDVVRLAPVSIVSETSADDRLKCSDIVTINRDKEEAVDMAKFSATPNTVEQTETVRRVSSEASVDDSSALKSAKVPEEQDDDDVDVSSKTDGEPLSKDEAEVNEAQSVDKEVSSNDQVRVDEKHQPEQSDATTDCVEEKPRNGKGMFVKKSAEKPASTVVPDSPILPVKRKRGRPPKNRPVPKVTSNEKAEPAVVPENSLINEVDSADSLPPPPKKRGPGRPPKNKSIATAKPEPSLRNDSANQQSNGQQSPTPRKRGRPPKKKAPVKVESNEDKKAEAAPPDPPKKRGPGRPPKHPKPEPSKNASSGDIAPPKKRGPGRPRKSETQATAQDGSAPVVKKRGPGRPRKSESQEPPKKRGPGRPRKVPKKEEESDDEIIEHNIFKVTMVNGSRPRKGPNRFSPTDFDSDSDSSVDTGANKKTSGSTPLKKSEFGPEHAEKARQVEVGMRVSVYWGGDQEYYPGTVTKERSYRKKKFFLEYDDGESEWIDFHRNKFHILTPPKNAGRGQQEDEKIASDDEEDSDDEDSTPLRRRSSDSDTDPSVRFRNRMDMADVMLRIKPGCRVEVFWSDDGCYYPGTITKQRDNIIQAKKPWFLEYDDGESEWIDLRDHVFRMIAGCSEEAAPSPDGASQSGSADKDKRKREKDADESSTAAKKQKRPKKKNSG